MLLNRSVGKVEIFLDIDVVQTNIVLSCFYSPARVLSSMSAKGSDDRQTEWSEQGQREREANSLDVAPGIDRRNKFKKQECVLITLYQAPILKAVVSTYLQANLAKM